MSPRSSTRQVLQMSLKAALFVPGLSAYYWPLLNRSSNPIRPLLRALHDVSMVHGLAASHEKEAGAPVIGLIDMPSDGAVVFGDNYPVSSWGS